MVIHDLIEVDTIDEVIYIKKDINPSEVRKVIRSCEELGVVFRLRHRDIHFNLSNAYTTEIGNTKFMTFSNIPTRPLHLQPRNSWMSVFPAYF